MLTVAAMMAAMLVATALPAFAQASENAGCVGQAFSEGATTAPPGAVGDTASFWARLLPPGEAGQGIAEVTQQPRDDCPPLNVQPPELP
jgi:hypothetical protein